MPSRQRFGRMLVGSSLVGIVLAFLGACATVPNTSVEVLKGEIPAGSGIVVAETLNNSARIAGPIERWTEIVLWRQQHEGEDNTFSITSMSHSLSTQAYMGAVPAGTYRIGLLWATLQILDNTWTARALIPPAMGTFEVKAGQVTNLGTILYQPFQDKNWTEKTYPDYAVTRIDNPGLWTSAGRAEPEVAAKIDPSLPVLGWNQDDFDLLRGMVELQMRTAALPTNLVALRTSGFVLSGVYGGLYSLRDGNWRNLSLPSHYKVTDVVELPDGRLLVGSELGNLGVGGTIGADLKQVPLGEKLRHVIDIDLSGSDQAYVVTFAETEYEIFRFNITNDSLTPLKSIPKKIRGAFAEAYNIGISTPHAIGTSAGLAVFMDKLVHRYDEATGEWSTDSATEFRSLYQQLDGTILGIPYSGWSGAKPLQYSTDNGFTWTTVAEKTGVFTGASRVPNYRFSDGEVLRTGKDADIRLFKVEAKDQIAILSTTDDGATWTTVGSVPQGCSSLATEASRDELVYILCSNGAVLASQDRGRSWEESLAPRIPNFDDFPPGLKVRFQRE